jgi:hypothetical protein
MLAHDHRNRKRDYTSDVVEHRLGNYLQFVRAHSVHWHFQAIWSLIDTVSEQIIWLLLNFTIVLTTQLHSPVGAVVMSASSVLITLQSLRLKMRLEKISAVNTENQRH